MVAQGRIIHIVSGDAGNGPMTPEARAKESESLLGRSKPEGHVREQLSGRHGEPALARSPLLDGLENPSSCKYVRKAKLARLHPSCRGNVEEKAYRLNPAKQRERFEKKHRLSFPV